MTCKYSKRQLENGPVSIYCTVITFLTAELLPKLEVLGFKCCRLYLPSHSRVGVRSGHYCADFDSPRPRAAMASTLPDSTSRLTSHLRQVSWGMIEQNCFERKQILCDCKRSRKVNFVDRHLEYLSLWYG